jgi:hypothetical protein
MTNPNGTLAKRARSIESTAHQCQTVFGTPDVGGVSDADFVFYYSMLWSCEP